MIKSSVAGVVERVNRLICVRPLRTRQKKTHFLFSPGFTFVVPFRYNGDIGDVVVGRIKEVGGSESGVRSRHQDFFRLDRNDGKWTLSRDSTPYSCCHRSIYLEAYW